LSSLISELSVQQAFKLCTILSALALVAAATRLLSVAAWRQYRPFLCLLLLWFAICVVALTIPVSSRVYFRFYSIAAPLSWFVYLLVARDLYQNIFQKFRGIAFAGRWCLYISASLLLAVAFASFFLSGSVSKPGPQFEAVAFVDRSVLFGLAFFLVLLVSVIVRYPISIQRNLVVHTLVFSGILFFQSIVQVADQWSAYRYTAFCNTLTAGLDAVLITAWAILLTKAGETIRIRIRHNIKPEMELQLLGQLDTLNGILLRAARK
jgi:hypothetical protein